MCKAQAPWPALSLASFSKAPNYKYSLDLAGSSALTTSFMSKMQQGSKCRANRNKPEAVAIEQPALGPLQSV